MPGGNKNIKGTDGNTFSSTNQPQNRGRKKKIYTILKEKGYGKDDIVTAFGELAFYTLTELDEISTDDNKPIITRIVARSFKEAYKKSDWNKIKEILEHVIGKPMSSLDLSNKDGSMSWGVKPNPEEIKEISKELENDC